MANPAGRVGSVAVSTDGGTVYNAIGCVTDLTINKSKGEFENTCRSSQDYRTYGQDRKDVTVDFTAIWDEDDAQLMLVSDAYDSDTLYYYRFRYETDSGKREWTGQGFVTNFTDNDPNDGGSTVTATIRITGAWTKATQT